MNPELKGIPNPFRNGVVADPWQSNAGDVPEIHNGAFDLCREVLGEVLRDGKTRSVVLYGETGSGKTHLLRRLRAAWLGEPPHDVDPIRPEVVFVAAKLQTSPQHLWRYLRQSLVDDLLRLASDGTSQLERILLRRLAEVRPADADLRLWFEWLRGEHPDPADLEATLEGLMERINGQARLGRDPWVVLVHLLLGRHRRDANAWLRGDPLPEQALKALGVAPTPDDVSPEEQAREVVAALCRLAGPKVSVVFCFDQIEALQVDRGDTAALFAFGKLVMDLFHETQNVLMISCVQIGFIEVLGPAMLQAAWQRMAMQRRAIDPLRWEDVVRLAAARMDALPPLKALRAARGGGPLWPLDEARLRARLGNGDTARRVLAECADQFEAVQSDRAATRPPAPRLAETWTERLTQARRANSPERSGEIMAHGLPLLLKATSPGLERVPDHGLGRDVDLVWRGPDGRLGVHLSFAKDARSVWRPFTRLPELLRDGRLNRLVVARDPRVPLSGQKVKTYHDDLLKAGATALTPGVEALAALDALRGVLSDAKAGDLTDGERPVDLKTIEDWLAENLPDALRDLAEDLLSLPGGGPGGPPDDLAGRLTELLERRPVLPAEEAAAELGDEVGTVVALVKCGADAFGLIEGPPHVLFRLAAEPSRA